MSRSTTVDREVHDQLPGGGLTHRVVIDRPRPLVVGAANWSTGTMEPELWAGRERVHRVTADDRRVVPLWEGLRAEYRYRYGPAADRELARFPAADFAPPHGGFVVLTLDGETISGGGFRRYDE